MAGSLLRRLFRRTPPEEGRAFDLLVEKLSRIRYLTEQKAMLDVIEKTPVGICITNEERRFEYVNPAYCRIYGWSWDELVGKPFTIVVPPEHRRMMEDLHDRFMRQEYELSGEWEVMRKNGTRLSILANAAYVVDERGRPRKITFVVDITDRRKAEEGRAQLAGFLASTLSPGLSAVASRLRQAVGAPAGVASSAVEAALADLERLASETSTLARAGQEPASR